MNIKWGSYIGDWYLNSGETVNYQINTFNDFIKLFQQTNNSIQSHGSFSRCKKIINDLEWKIPQIMHTTDINRGLMNNIDSIFCLAIVDDVRISLQFTKDDCCYINLWENPNGPTRYSGYFFDDTIPENFIENINQCLKKK